MVSNDYVNLFDLTCDAINVIKKKDLVDYIEKIKGKVVADNQIKTYVVKLRISQIMLQVLRVPVKDSPVNWLL